MASKESKYQGSIFISYRRAGVRTQTYRLADELKRQYGESQIFLDVKSIDPGVRYADAIREALNSCAVILVMIGPKWSGICDDQGRRRLENPEDVLRIEVETALKAQARVIPVLVDGAEMPGADLLPEDIRDLADLQAFSLTESHWEYDVGQLVERLDAILGRKRKQKEAGDRLSFSGKVIAGLVLVGLVLLVYATGEVTDTSVAEGGILFALAGMIFCIFGYRDINAGKTRGHAAAIGGAVIGGLMTLALIGDHGDLPAPGEDGDASVSGIAVEQQSVTPASMQPQPLQPQTVQPQALQAQPVQPQPAVEAAPPVATIQAPVPQQTGVDLNGYWISADGLTYLFEQHGNQITFNEYNPLFNAITASGAGVLNGRQFDLTYQTAVGTAGQGRMTVSEDGESIFGAYTDLVTGMSQSIALERQ